MIKAHAAPSVARKTGANAPESVVPQEQHFVIDGVTWQQYLAIADAFPERPIRINYDDGWLEIMTISNSHERLKTLIHNLVMILASEFRREIGGFGSFTHQKESVKKAMEPDQCYYIANFEKVRELEVIDLERDPPPDLVIEIEISRSLLRRMKILAALGVPEVWRLDRNRLEISLLEKGAYHPVAASPTFPGMDLNEVIRFLEMRPKGGDLEMMQTFQKWVRSQRRKAKRGAK